MEPSGFREIARSAHTTYPIPFVFALSLAFSVLTLGGAIITEPPLRWAFVAFAGVSLLFAFGFVGWAAARRPELLKSERHQIAHRMLDLIGDNDLTPQTIDEVGRLVSGESRSKKGSRNQGSSRK